MKNLANCKPSEFVAQTLKIKKTVQDWLDATQLISILNTIPDYIQLPENSTAEQKVDVIRKNAKIQQEQGLQNLSKIIDKAFAQNPEKTLELLAHCCFVEPADVDKHPMSCYFKSITELMHDESILSFFTSLAQLAKKNTFKQ